MPSASSQPATQRSRTSSRSLTGFVRSRAEVRSTSVVASGASPARSERGSGGPWASTSRRQWSSQATRLNEEVPTCEFVINAAEDLAQFEVGAFDFVYSSIVLQHLPSRRDIERYVSEFLRVTKPEGLAVFGIPAHVAFPYSLQPRRRLYGLLRRLGVPEDWMLRRTSLTPMRMTVVTETAVRSLVEGAAPRCCWRSSSRTGRSAPCATTSRLLRRRRPRVGVRSPPR